MIQYNPTVSGSLVVTGSLITTGNINGINLSTFSASINNALTESKVTHIVSASAGIYYIDGTSKPSMSVVPGLTYRFETAIVDVSHPFKFSTSQNGPTQYVDGVTSGSNFIQLEVNYNTPDVLYYYCTIHSNMGNAINVLKIDKLLTTLSSSFDSRYVISGSITQTTWDNIASKPSGIVSSSVQVLGGTNIVSGSSQLTASALATTGSNTFIGNQNISGTVYLTGSLIPSGNFVYDLGSETNSFGDLFISTGSIRFHNPDGTEQGRITVDAKSGDISLLKTVGLTNEQKLTIKQGNINPTFLSAISASSLFVQTKIVTAAAATINGINLTAFSSSVSNTILNQNSATSSYETKGRGIISGSSQLDGTTITNLTVTNLTTVNETASVIFSSGSNRFGDFGDDIHNFTGSVQVTGSFTLVGSSTATSYSGIINATNGVVSGSSQVVSILSSLNTYTGSQDTKNSTLATYTASLDTKNATLATYTASLDTKNSTLATYTASLETKNLTLATYTSSVDTKFTSVGISTASLNTYTASLKTALQLTGSNVVVLGDLTVLGTTSTANSTTLNVSDKFITLASGSTTSALANGAGFRITGANVTMSWDSTNSQLKFNTDISASKFYGDGTGLTFNGSGIVSGSSQIVSILSSLNTYTGSNDTTNTLQNARLTTIESVTGSYETKGRGIVSGSSQVTGIGNAQLTNSSTTIGTTAISLGASSTTLVGLTSVTSTAFVGALTGNASTVTTNANLTGNVTSIGNATTIAAGVVTNAMLAGSISNANLANSSTTIGTTAISLGASSTTLAGLTSVSSTGFTGALTGNASTATTLATARTINGTSFDGSANITIPSLVSGSSQVTMASTTGFGTYINQAVLTTSSPTFAGVTLTSTLNLPTGALISVNNEPNTWGAAYRTTASTTNLGASLKNIVYCGGSSTEGFTVTGTGTGTSAFEVRNDGRAWIKENLTVAGTITANGSAVRTDATTSYSTTFTSVSSVSVTHSLGTKNVMVMCYDSADEMFWPATIKTTSTTVVDITFTTARTGRVVIIR